MGQKRLKSPAPGAGTGKIVPPSTEPTPLLSTEHPVFCFRFLRAGWDFAALPGQETARAVAAMYTLSQQTWATIRQRGHRNGGSEVLPVGRLLHGAGQPPEAFRAHDKFVVCRYSDAGRLAGFRVGPVFHLVWITATHALY